MELGSGVSIIGAMRASAAAGPLQQQGRGPIRFALAWLDDVARAKPDQRPAIDAALRQLAASEDPTERAVVVDFFGSSDVAHWFWPAAESILAASPEIASVTRQIRQPDAPPLRLADLSDRLKARFLGQKARTMLLWTELPKPTLITARYVGEVLEALETAADSSGLGSLTWLAAAAESSAWLGPWLPWLTAQVPGAAQATALAAWLEQGDAGATPRTAPPYIRQVIEASDVGVIRFGGHTLRGVADLRAAVEASIALARTRRCEGFEVPRPLGWVQRLLASHPPWHPLVDVALRQLVSRDDGGVAWLVEWALAAGDQLAHTPKTAAALGEVAVADADVIAAAFNDARRRQVENAANPGDSQGDAAQDPSDRDPPGGDVEPSPERARALVREALLNANKRPYIQSLEALLATEASWLGEDADVSDLAICLRDLAAQLADEGHLQLAQAPKVVAAKRW